MILLTMMMMVVVVVVLMCGLSVCFSVFVFILLFCGQCPRGKAPLIIGIFLVFFSSVLSTRTTLDTGCFRNMAGSWDKALAEPCRVRTDSFVYLWSMYADGTGPLPCVIFFHLTFLGFLFYFCTSTF